MSNTEEKKKQKGFVNNFIKVIIQREPAEEIFNELLEYYDIDFKDIEIDQGEEGALTVKNKLVRGIMRGRMETDTTDQKEGFQIIQHIRDGTSVTYHEYDITALEEATKSKGVKGVALMGSLCDKGLPRLRQLRGPDLKFVEFLAVLFSL